MRNWTKIIKKTVANSLPCGRVLKKKWRLGCASVSKTLERLWPRTKNDAANAHDEAFQRLSTPAVQRASAPDNSSPAPLLVSQALRETERRHCSTARRAGAPQKTQLELKNGQPLQLRELP